MSKQIEKAIAERDAGPSQLIETYRADLTAVLPRHVKPEQWMRLSVGLLRKNKQLAQVAQANPWSLMSALLDCARLGLEPGVTYHLVPFGSEIVGISDYKGLIELMYNSGSVRSVKSEVIRAGDLERHPDDGKPRFLWEPDEMERPRFKPDWFADRGDLIGAYAYAVMDDGAVSQVIVMNKGEIEKVRAVSKTAKKSDSPWNVWPDRMFRKTVLRQLAKFVPTSTEKLTATAERLDSVPDLVLPHRDELPPVPDRPLYDDGDVVDADVVDQSAAGVAAPSDQLVSAAGLKQVHTLLTTIGVTDQAERRTTLGVMVGRTLGSSKELTMQEASGVFDVLSRLARQDDPATALSVYLGSLDMVSES